MSIRGRLTLWYLVLLFVGLAAFAVAVDWQFEQSMRASVDDTLRRQAQGVAMALHIDSSQLHEANLRPHYQQSGELAIWIRLLGPHQRLIASLGPNSAGLPVDLLADLRPGFHESAQDETPHLRIFILPVMSPGRPTTTIQVISSLAGMDATHYRLVKAMEGAAVLIVLVAALSGLFLADRALRPVDRIARLAAQIGAGDLHRRVGDEVWRDARGRWQHNDELHRLTGTFDAMLGRLEEAAERRRQLTADAAHELCTPIATIAAGAEIALRHPRSADEYRASLRHVLDESRHMGLVVDDLLLLARADAGQLALHQDLVEMDEVCRAAVHAFQPLAQARTIALSALLPSQSLLVMGDELRLGQVIRNLLDNALRYTPAGGVVEVVGGIGTDANGSEIIAVRVSDTGPGLTSSEQERIFERFHRVVDGSSYRPSADHRSGGSGLGLGICKAIVDAHGGRIRVESEGTAGSGATVPGSHFVIELPAVASGC